SLRMKLFFANPAMGAPCSSVTVTNTLTRFTSTFTVVSGLDCCSDGSSERLGFAVLGSGGACCAQALQTLQIKTKPMADSRLVAGFLIRRLLSDRIITLQPDHLDARHASGLPHQDCAFGISAGNGSPSAQTAPSSKNSFFQMGTVRLSVSINHRHASKAAARCADPTTIRTLVSPISRRPSRCTMLTSLILNCWIAFDASDSSCARAISSVAS